MKRESRILFGQCVADEIENQVKEKVRNYIATYNEVPCLATILVGDDESSEMYVRMKSKACERVGIKHRNIKLDTECTTEKVVAVIGELNMDDSIVGIMLQHPLLPHIDERKCFDSIDVRKDVDGLNSQSFGNVAMGVDAFSAATALAILKVLKYYEIGLDGRDVVIIGRSAILGKPLAMMLLNENATVSICHSKTKDLVKHLSKADIVISCVGVKALVKEHYLNSGVIVIDAGYDENCGDYFHENLAITQAYTPVPKGIGPVTIACLLEQTIEAAYKLKNK